MINKQKNGVTYNKFEIIHTLPKMADTDKEKNKKALSNDLYEIFLRIQSHLKSDNKIHKSGQL